MPKRSLDQDENADEKLLSVPLPIQTFLWRQTSPFIRPKIGRLREASCLEQREACKSFEKVLVQNIQFGLSPSLTEAIRSISRWHLVRASLPHVMHCLAALLHARKDSCIEKLGAAETKLLYTLHWILLDAAEECADAEAEKGILRTATHYLFSISAIQVPRTSVKTQPREPRLTMAVYVGGTAFWSFLDFVVTHRTPLFVLLYPFINYRVLKTICDNEHEYYYQQLIREKLQGFSLPPPKSRGQLFQDVVLEMKNIKEDVMARKMGADMDRKISMSLESHSLTEASHSGSYNRGIGLAGSLAGTGNGSGTPVNLPSSPPCSSFTEIQADKQSVTRLASIASITSSFTHKPPLSRDWSTQSERVPHRTSRGLSIRLNTRDTGRRVVERFLRRTSFPFPEEDTMSSQGKILGSEHTASSSEPRLFRKSTLQIKKRGSKKGSGNLYAEGSDSREGMDDKYMDRQESGPSNQSLTDTERGPGVQSPDQDKPRHRLQRQKAQSRKTFRFRKSRRGAGFAPHPETGEPEATEEIAMGTPKKHASLIDDDFDPNYIYKSTESEKGLEYSNLPDIEFHPMHSQQSGESVDYKAPRRRGAVHHRSPSPSPERGASITSTSKDGDTYIIQCESTESLSNSENAALLKEEEKGSASQSSLLMVFPSKEGLNCV